jgi:RNA polymerase sigma-70 factor (ECF subfamily)
MRAHSDQELVQAANRGDPGAFDELYHRYKDWVVRLAYRFTRNEDDSLDVLQDAFAYFLSKFPGFELTAQVTTFLYPVVKNLSLENLRKKRREIADDDLLVVQSTNPEQHTRAEIDDLLNVMSSLPPLQKEVVTMRFVDDMKLGEIAEALNIPVGTVKSRLHHAIQALRTDERTRRYFRENGV